MNVAQICGSEGILSLPCGAPDGRILNAQVNEPAENLLALGNLAELLGELTGSDYIA
jgi:hypothetical protein